MFHLGCVTLRSNSRLLCSNSSSRQISYFYHSLISKYSRPLYHFNCDPFHQDRLLNPNVSDFKSRSFHLCRDFLTDLHWKKDPSILCQTPLNFQGIPSLTMHTTSFRNGRKMRECPTLKTVFSDVQLELLDTELPLHRQMRFLQSRAKRKQKERTFSSQQNLSNPSGEKESEGKDLKEENDENKLTLYQRFRKTYKEHGKVLVVVHLATSAVWFGSFYTAARCGFDIVPLLESWNLSERVISPFRSGGLGDVALAYLMYKLATPARYTVTIGGTNLAIRYLRKEGRMQPVAKEDTLRQLYKEGKADLRTRGIKTRRRIRHMRARIQGQIRKRRKRPPHDRKSS